MKKALPVSIAVCAVWALYPLCIGCARLTGCEYRLRSPVVYLLIGIALLLAAVLGRGRSALCMAALPLVCISADLILINYGTWKISLLILIALVFAVVLFARSRCRLLFKLPLGLISGLLCVLTLLLCLLGSIEFVAVETKDFRSPGKKYIAEVCIRDEGALGGSTQLSVRTAARVRGLFGEFSHMPETYYSGSWLNSMPEVEWIDETRFSFNGKSYSVQP